MFSFFKRKPKEPEVKQEKPVTPLVKEKITLKELDELLTRQYIKHTGAKYKIRDDANEFIIAGTVKKGDQTYYRLIHVATELSLLFNRELFDALLIRK